MKSVIVVTFSFICLLLPAAEKMIIDDTMTLPLRRSWTLASKKQSSPWQLDQEVTINADRVSVSFGRNTDSLQKFEIAEAISGKKIFNYHGGRRIPQWLTIANKGKYILRASGKPTAVNAVITVSSYKRIAPDKKELLWLPNWNPCPTVAIEDAGLNGITLVPSGKLNFIQTVLYGRLKKGKNYRMEFEVQTFENQNVFIRARWGAKRGNFGNRNFSLSPAEGVRKLSLDFVPQSSDAVSLTIYCERKLQIRRFRLWENASAPAVRTRMIGSNKAYFEHRNPHKEPANPAVRTPVFFRRPPRITFFDSIPQPHEIVNKLDTFTAPGEYAVWYFGVHNPAGDRSIVGISISDLKCGKNTIPAKDISLNFVEFQDYPLTASNFMNIPERILPLDKQPSGKLNRIFWLQGRIAADAVPGIYSGMCSVDCSGKTISVPIRLRVLPFKLAKPEHVHWTMYTNLFHGQKSRWPRAAHKRYLQDMKDYGIESIQVRIASERRVKYVQELRKELGMSGPMILAGTSSEQVTAKALGYKPAKTRLVYEKNGVSAPWYEFADIRAGFVERLKNFDSWIKKYGGKGYDKWYYEGHDEPHLYKDRWASAIWQYKLAKQAGVKTSCCIYPVAALDEIGPYLDVSTNMLIGSDADSHRRLLEVGKKHNIAYVYLGAGSYVGQEGGLMPNRLTAGLRMFKLGLPGHISYTYMEPDFPVNHFERGKRYHMAYPVSKRPDGKDRVVYSTLQLEGLREGITDYKYLYTLERAIANARKSGKTAAADNAAKVLKQILDEVPFSREAGSPNGITQKHEFSNTTVEHIRMLVANEILKLQLEN
ncbi:MAG: hypothetical protein E7042_00680 [Lentisphaerae bacterium]|nr:hypothetical protein [Lentisphaerota bacterium]